MNNEKNIQGKTKMVILTRKVMMILTRKNMMKMMMTKNPNLKWKTPRKHISNTTKKIMKRMVSLRMDTIRRRKIYTHDRKIGIFLLKKL